MARKKKRKQSKKKMNQFKLELLGLLFIFLSIFGSGASMISDGLIPNLLEHIFRFLFGIWYFIASITLLIIGVFLIIKRKVPTLFTRRNVGIFMIFLGVLLFTHIQTFDRLLISIEETSIIKETWRHFTAFLSGTGVSAQLGGGMVGAILFATTYFLFSFVGAKIVAIFTMIIGVLFLTNFLLGNLYKKINKWLKEQWGKFQTKREAKEKKEAMHKQGDEDSSFSETTTKVVEEFTEEEEPVAVNYSSTQPIEEQTIPIEQQSSQKSSLDESEIKEHDSIDHDYELPPIQLLDEPTIQSQQRDKAKINETVQTLEATFQSFGVKAKITKAHVGPAVTKYEVYPEALLKVSRILNLQDDLALALAAQDIRIEAPIPGKSAIGIEVPNREIATVSLREVIDVNRARDKKLLFALGRDISGNAIVGELNKMPHLLIAGATGSGKSVCINGIITSILMRAKPTEVKMMMIDPKKVELNVYNGIPHLLTPVVTDPKKASLALRKVVVEMERRYELFSETGTRNLESYNEYIRKENKTSEEETTLLPYIVVLVDELADLMMVASKDVEDSITRLAQMARAAGIHLIIATQRPSVDVITGVIKANIPSRIAFSVSSQVDSRTILDIGGAEKLLGRGDMLYIPVGNSKPIRVQGAFMSDEEVERIVNHCKNEQSVVYEEKMIPEATETSEAEETDELFSEAVSLVANMQTASVSMLQRRFRIGYNRAARLIDAMEERGIVGPYEGNRPREVLIEKPLDENISNS